MEIERHSNRRVLKYNKFLRSDKVIGIPIDSTNEKSMLRQVKEETGFVPEKNLYTHWEFFDKMRIRDKVYEGYDGEGRLSILKLEGIKVNINEIDMIRAFENQNKSTLIRAPKVYFAKKWSAKTGYGFILMEHVGDVPIFNTPFATHSDQDEYIRFYQDYKTRAVTKPFIVTNAQEKPLNVHFKRIDYHRRMCEAGGRLKLNDYAPYVMRYYYLISRHMNVYDTEFSHTLLFPEHILKQKDGMYVLIDHASWRFTDKWADLSMNIWRSWMDIKDNSYTAEQLIDLVESWKKAYKKMQIVQKDPQFDHRFYTLMLDRSISTITADLGAGMKWGQPEYRPYLRHALKLQQQLFDYFVRKLEEF